MLLLLLLLLALVVHAKAEAPLAARRAERELIAFILAASAGEVS